MKGLDEIKARLDAATPGSWIWMDGLDAIWAFSDTYDDIRDETPSTVFCFDTRVGYETENAELIANTPTDMRRLIARVEKLEQRITEAIEWIDSGEPRQSRVILRAALAKGDK